LLKAVQKQASDHLKLNSQRTWKKAGKYKLLFNVFHRIEREEGKEVEDRRS